jgi:hypothetical protein
MIVINKGFSANTFSVTLSEKLNEYNLPINSGSTFYFTIQNDYNENKIEQFSLTDISQNPYRFNKFTFDETQYDLDKGMWSYSASTSAYTETLEIGRMLIQ